MALSEASLVNFQTMLRAAKAGHLAIMECTEIASGETRAVICAVQQAPEGQIHILPFGHLCPGNPYEAYLSPPDDEPTPNVAPRRVKNH